ncbi:hypothetical protein H9Q72_009205 [Fusarium xylarioides]|uniref:Uncharacterized protein n=1 Tax=Fusarium xylarioides TaxID=221167 RepID=A0A9P7HN70_9HYPO|nr:hypothetical protein H9Q72_009205 [Fusarium xylarioides]
MDVQHVVPDKDKFDHSDPGQRIAYLFAMTGYYGCSSYPVFESLKDSAPGLVCASLETNGHHNVSEAKYHFALEEFIWGRFFDHLGENAPQCPWRVTDFQGYTGHTSEVYQQWRRSHCLRTIVLSPEPELRPAADRNAALNHDDVQHLEQQVAEQASEIQNLQKKIKALQEQRDCLRIQIDDFTDN